MLLLLMSMESCLRISIYGLALICIKKGEDLVAFLKQFSIFDEMKTKTHI